MIGFNSKKGLMFFSSPGFTLLEVMVAVAIIAIAVVTLITSQSQSVTMAGISRFNITASLLAQQKMAELELSDFTSLVSGEEGFQEPFSDFSWKLEAQELSGEETGIAGSDGLLKLLTLTIRSNGDKRLTYAVRSIVMAKIEPREQ